MLNRKKKTRRSSSNRRFGYEHLECRELMAADITGGLGSGAVMEAYRHNQNALQFPIEPPVHEVQQVAPASIQVQALDWQSVDPAATNQPFTGPNGVTAKYQGVNPTLQAPSNLVD